MCFPITSIRELSRKLINFYISIKRRVDYMTSWEFNLDDFVPTVDTAAENELRALRSRITFERRWKFVFDREPRSRPNACVTTNLCFRSHTLWQNRMKSLRSKRKTTIETRKSICNPGPFDRRRVPILMQINPHPCCRYGLYMYVYIRVTRSRYDNIEWKRNMWRFIKALAYWGIFKYILLTSEIFTKHETRLILIIRTHSTRTSYT